MDPCRCGGMRQVVRVVHHPGGEAPASPAQVERNVRHRSDEEALPHGRRKRP
jgi:glutathione S-transferase